MPTYYQPPSDSSPGRWISDTPDMSDMENIVFDAPGFKWYNFVVVGNPTRISPQWLAKHPGYGEGDNYEFAVSYSVHTDDLAIMLDESPTPVDAFNLYLEGTGEEWITIDRIELVNRRDPWENG